MLRTDGTNGGGWARWLLLAVILLYAGIVILVSAETSGRRLLGLGVTVVGGLNLLGLGHVWRRMWRRASERLTQPWTD